MTDESAGKAKAAKPRKPKAVAPVTVPQVEPVALASPAAALPETVSLVPVSPENAVQHFVDTIEADPSPAIQSDAIDEGAAALSQAAEELTDMATVSPTETTDKAQALFGDFSNRFKTAFEKSTKLSEDFVDFAKGNVEAVIASARVAAQAGEALSQDAAAYGKKNLETATAAFKSFATVKSPTELFQLQSEFAKSQFDAAVAEASKVSETWLKVAGEIAQPISNRYALAAEKFKASAL